MQVTWKSLCISLFAVLAVALVAACGGGDDKTGATATVKTTASQRAGTSTSAPTQEPASTANSGGGSGNDLDACTLLTTAEVAGVIGETGEGHLTIDGDTSSCFWATPGEEKQVEVVVGKGVFDSSILLGGQAVDGLGDEAVWVTGLGIIDVLAGNYNFQVSFTQPTGTSDADQMNATKTLAQKVLDRLP